MDNFWKKLSLLGVSDEMPVYWQKSIILYNQVARMLVLIILFTSVVMFYKMDMVIVPVAFLLTTPVIAFSLFLNMKGKVNISIMIISVFFPLFFLATSVYSKLNGEGLGLIFYIAPRFGIIISIIFPVVLYGFNDYRKAVWGGLTGTVVFITFDWFHLLFGIDVHNIPYYPKNYLFVVFGLAIVLIFFTFLTIFLQRINTIYEQLVLKQKAEIEKQRDYANQQHEEIKKQKQQITDSIVYASRIQTAVLPQKSYIENILENYFILFKPRDIVSGDFYFFQQKGDLIYIVAADSTGHGVPGAFMSMLGITFLNAIINKEESANKIPFVGGFVDRIQEIRTKEPNAASILDALRSMVKNALGQTGAQDEAKDGMDLALCILNTKTLEMQYSGAHNPLYLFRDNSLIEYKGDRMPIGIHIKEKPFTDHTIQLKKGDAFYLFSDGFVDQFGGKSNSKYKAKRFKQFLAEIQENTMSEQKERLLNEFKTWKGTYEQVDDVIVIGVKI